MEASDRNAEAYASAFSGRHWFARSSHGPGSRPSFGRYLGSNDRRIEDTGGAELRLALYVTAEIQRET